MDSITKAKIRLYSMLMRESTTTDSEKQLLVVLIEDPDVKSYVQGD